MKRTFVLGLLGATLMYAGSSVVFAADKCQLVQDASLALGTDVTGGVYVQMTIDGHEEKLLVNTSAFISLLTSSAADRLGLRRRKIGGILPPTMYGGAQLREIAMADEISLGGMKGSQFGFFVMPDRFLPAELSGSIGLDVLRHYDVDLDIANAKLKLFSPDHCPGQVVYWTHQPYAQVPMQVDAFGQIKFPIQLDGKPLDARLATGLSRTALSFESAKDVFGWGDKTIDLQPVRTTKDGTPLIYHFPFKSLAFSGVAVSNPDIMLVPDRISDTNKNRELLIGMNVLRQLHIYLAFREKNLYLTPADAN